MPLNQVYSDGAGAAPVNAVETVSVTLQPNVSVRQGVLVVLQASVCLTAGATTTALVARVRRGTTTAGALCGAAFTIPLAAAATGSIFLQVSDTPGEVAGQAYVLTLQQTAGTGNGVPVWSSLSAEWNV